VLVEALSSGGRLRPSGFFMHPIVYADFLFLALPFVAIGTAVVKARLGRWLLGATTLIGLAGLALTLSRGAWLSSAVAAAVLLWLSVRLRLADRRALRRIALVGLVAVMIGAALFGPRVWQRLTQSDTGNVDVRFDLNRIALRMVVDRPLHGQGLNAFVETMERFVKSYFPAPVHNLYLLEAAEAGIPALLLLLGVLGVAILNPLRRVGRIEDPLLRAVVAAAVAGLCGLAVSQLADFSFKLEPLRTLIWAIIGLAFGALGAGEKALLPASRRVERREG
jgi:O-antigen ligase